MTSPAEQRAAREHLAVVAVANFDLIQALSGHPIIVSDMDGNEVLLRLYTPDELLRLYTPDELLGRAEQARRDLEGSGIQPGPGMSYAKAVELTTPTGA